MRSDEVKKGFDRTPHRSLLRATGLKDEDFDKPFIGVANSFIELIPGHFFLDKVSAIIKEEIRANGCVPFEFNTIGVDDGIAMGHDGMLFSLPSRELIANSIETVMNAHKLDAMIAIPNCDKIVPGMIMGALRVNVPTIFVSGGPMEKGYTKDGTPIDLATAFEAVGKHEAGQMSDEELKDIELNDKSWINEMEKIAEINPRAAIIEAWTTIELSCIKKGFTTGNVIQRFNPKELEDYLKNIDESVSNKIKDLRNLRNKLVHEHQFDFDFINAKKYIELSDKIISILNKK